MIYKEKRIWVRGIEALIKLDERSEVETIYYEKEGEIV